jgi:cyanate lyase
VKVETTEQTEQEELRMRREEVTQKIITAKMAKGLKGADIADRVGRSKEWTTAALLGQMPMSKEEAEAAGAIFELDAEDIQCLQAGPYRGSLGQTVPTDPLIYRFYEIVQVYGTTLKALIEEEFGDGIMSAIDFTMDVRLSRTRKGTGWSSRSTASFCLTSFCLTKSIERLARPGSPSSIFLHEQPLFLIRCRCVRFPLTNRPSAQHI